MPVPEPIAHLCISSIPLIQRAVPVIAVKLEKVMVLFAERVVNAAVLGALAPIAVPLIAPPVMLTLLAAKLLAVTAPKMVVESSAEPMLIVSATVLFVPMLMISPALPVPMLRVLAKLPKPRLTVPVVPESRLSAPVVPEVIARAVALPDESVPVPAKPSAVAEVVMVSMEETPVSAPAVVTFNPPFEVRANVPVAFPIVRLPEFVAIETVAP